MLSRYARVFRFTAASQPVRRLRRLVAELRAFFAQDPGGPTLPPTAVVTSLFRLFCPCLVAENWHFAQKKKIKKITPFRLTPLVSIA